MERLKTVSALIMSEFMQEHKRSLRAHIHDWTEISRPHGFKHLNEQLRANLGWQFQLSSNEHGRVHGFFIDHTFYVIWLDKDHRLYLK